MLRKEIVVTPGHAEGARRGGGPLGTPQRMAILIELCDGVVIQLPE